jgi:hypothetical protein
LRFEEEIYTVLTKLFQNEMLDLIPAQAHTRLGTLITYELKYGSISQAREILSNGIDGVSPVQRDSCEKLCLARIAFAERNFDLALKYIDQGNTHDSLHYYPLFKAMLLRILVYLEQEIRFGMERENLYKYLHSAKHLPERDLKSYHQFYKYIDYMNETKYRGLSAQKRKKIKEFIESKNGYFLDKDWMIKRFGELESKIRGEQG